MKRYEIYPHLSDDIIAIEDNKGEYVKHDEAHALLKEAYESIVELCEIGMRARDQADLVDKAEQWLKENR